MTYRDLITKVLSERGLAIDKINRRIIAASLAVPFNPEATITKGADDLMTALHETFDFFDRDPVLKEHVRAIITKQSQEHRKTN